MISVLESHLFELIGGQKRTMKWEWAQALLFFFWCAVPRMGVVLLLVYMSCDWILAPESLFSLGKAMHSPVARRRWKKYNLRVISGPIMSLIEVSLILKREEVVPIRMMG